MKFMLMWVLLGFLNLGVAQNKEVSSTDKSSSSLQKLVQQYDAIQSFKVVIQGESNPRPLPPDRPEDPLPPPQKPPPRPPSPPACDPDYGGGSPTECVEAVCGQLSYFECNSREKLMEITKMCRNVRASCIRAVCSRLGSHDCDERGDLEKVTGICRGHYDSSCIDYVCSRLPRWDCDEFNEIREIANQCR